MQNMDTNYRNVGSAKDFFLQLGTIVSFYASAIALVTLIFEVIDFAYPKVVNAYIYYSSPSISFQVATLIVAFPLFLFLSWTLQKSFLTEPALRESLVRRWLSYITIFVAGGVVAGDLVTLVYMYLDGQDLTAGFLLKVLALLIIAGGIFLYYFREIRNVITTSERNLWRIAAALIIIGSIITGFTVVGSPKEQRERRYDNQRVSDLQTIQWQIVNYWQQKESLPATLEELRDPISGFMIPADPEGKAYEYNRTSPLSFKLCAEFNKPSAANSPSMPMMYPAIGKMQENWQHDAGKVCFDRSIDPELYPPVKR